ncbi:hypothetical protein HG530_006579 [Fusarium avenaceum]|nr:hypothetical protein HG530_006579 [Fusarium avenaceum]
MVSSSKPGLRRRFVGCCGPLDVVVEGSADEVVAVITDDSVALVVASGGAVVVEGLHGDAEACFTRFEVLQSTLKSSQPSLSNLVRMPRKPAIGQTKTNQIVNSSTEFGISNLESLFGGFVNMANIRSQHSNSLSYLVLFRDNTHNLSVLSRNDFGEYVQACLIRHSIVGIRDNMLFCDLAKLLIDMLGSLSVVDDDVTLALVK